MMPFKLQKIYDRMAVDLVGIQDERRRRDIIKNYVKIYGLTPIPKQKKRRRKRLEQQLPLNVF